MIAVIDENVQLSSSRRNETGGEEMSSSVGNYIQAKTYGVEGNNERTSASIV